jgi:ribosomal protein S18 acetylase RimI-like enzyme
MTTIRAARPDDRAAFLEMWDDFVQTDPNEPGDRGMGPVNWDRIMDPANPLSGLVAEAEGAPVGFLLYVPLPFTWSQGDVCYLEDIYVHPGARGAGHAARMIAALAAIGRERGWYKIFWMTQAHNAAAQRLYDRVALRRDYIRYDLPVLKA